MRIPLVFFLMAFVFTIKSTTLFASREFKLFRLYSSASVDRGSSMGGAAYIKVSCQNQSNLAQNITVSVSDEKYSVRACVLNQSGITGWAIDRCSISKNVTYSRTGASDPEDMSSQSYRLAPGNEGGITFRSRCISKLSGPDCRFSQEAQDSDFSEGRSVGKDYFCTDENNANITNCIRNGSMDYSVNVGFIVTEDRGAITCAVYINPALPGTSPSDKDYRYVPVNGGRPF